VAAAENSIPSEAKPTPVSTPMTGTSNMAGSGGRPKQKATSSGATPYRPARVPRNSTSPVTISSTSTGADSIASYTRW
jgi:hypothetical protein